MKFKKSSVTSQKEILKRKLGGELFEEIKLDDSAFTNGVCKAGNPISAEGKKVNAGTSAHRQSKIFFRHWAMNSFP